MNWIWVRVTAVFCEAFRDGEGKRREWVKIAEFWLSGSFGVGRRAARGPGGTRTAGRLGGRQEVSQAGPTLGIPSQ